MSIVYIPIWVIFLVTFISILIAIECGYRLGHLSHNRSEDEKESPVSAMAASVLGLTAFLLAFTFSIVANRYDSKMELVREDANAIHTAFLRTSFLPKAERVKSQELLNQYLNSRLAVAQRGKQNTIEDLKKAMQEALSIQDQLWAMVAKNDGKDMNSEPGALYIDSLNDLFKVHALRVAVGVQARIPYEIWLALYFMTVLGMVAVGYQTGIAASRRSLAAPLVALSFALVFSLIAALDKPNSGIIKVTQQPLVDVQHWMENELLKNKA